MKQITVLRDFSTHGGFSMHSPRELIEDIGNGKMVILIDNEDRENEGDIVLAANFATAETINFMAKEARGLICLALNGEQIEKLSIPLMVENQTNRSLNKTAFTVSIEAAHGVSTGISAADRAHTIRVASNPRARASDLIMPGHVFPIRAKRGGVLKRAGHTEGSVDLARLAGLNPAAVICEIMKEDGTMARFPDLVAFAEKFGFRMGTIEDLISYRLENETLISQVVDEALFHPFSRDFRVRVFKNILDGSENIVIQKGIINKGQPTLVRVQVENIMGDVFRGGPYDSGSHIQSILKIMASSPSAVFVYLRKEGENSMISRQVKSFSDKSEGSPQMDSREYGIGAQILRELGVGAIHLMARNKPNNIGLRSFGLNIVKVSEDGA